MKKPRPGMAITWARRRDVRCYINFPRYSLSNNSDGSVLSDAAFAVLDGPVVIFAATTTMVVGRATRHDIRSRLIWKVATHFCHCCSNFAAPLAGSCYIYLSCLRNIAYQRLMIQLPREPKYNPKTQKAPQKMPGGLGDGQPSVGALLYDHPQSNKGDKDKPEFTRSGS